ncbi:hypothetical protein MBFIL_00090 [Methanobrevibacter filiformis]|uniref:Uncharacterized protein n=2 Tax=Methanobrevibacter filiformis TaxID=55758 RepID=A0A166FI16_9EURY|nr:hypothetical protein MBFIL_00090 [Methanobrevibacter filiformis]
MNAFINFKIIRKYNKELIQFFDKYKDVEGIFATVKQTSSKNSNKYANSLDNNEKENNYWIDEDYEILDFENLRDYVIKEEKNKNHVIVDAIEYYIKNGVLNIVLIDWLCNNYFLILFSYA